MADDRGRSGVIRQGLGLRLVVGSVIAMIVVLALTLTYERSQHRDQVRVAGVNLARLLVALQNENDADVARVLEHQLGAGDLAYGVVAAAFAEGGDRWIEVVAPGVVTPQVVLEESRAWLQEASRELAGDGRAVIEYYGPIKRGTRPGYYRLGFFEPAFAIALDQIAFLASLTLPVFLLAPLFLYLIRREVRPLRALKANMSDVIGDDGQAPNVEGFVDQFNAFLDHAKARVDTYQAEKNKLITAERFLSYRLQRSENILQSFPDGLIVLDAEARATFANLRVKELLDVEPSQAVNLGPSQWPAGNDLRRFLTAFEKNPESVIGDTFVYQPGHLRDVSVALSAHAVRGVNNVASGYILVVRDVTQEVLARTGSSEFVAHVSHELKSPLNTLAMYCEALKGEDGESREFQLEATNVISDEVERLAKLISNLLSVTQIEMGTMELDRQRVRFAEFVMDCVESAKRSARDLDLDIEVDLPPDLPAVQIDKDLMRIAINNLLTNAIKYTDSGGHVRITAEDSDDAVTLCVSDTGIGIPEAELARIFEKFYRSDAAAAQSRSGHGLGLPLAQEIVQMHHGTLRVESTVGEGSQFYIDLWKNTGVAEQAISG